MIKQSLKLLACGLLFFGPGSQAARAELQVFSCEPEWTALAKALGGEHLAIYNATTNQQDPHHIQARPSLIARARGADLLICTGAELEIGWLPLLLRKSGNAKIQPGQPGHFMATDHVKLVDQPLQLDRSGGDLHAAGNPHVHLDPDRVQQIANRLTETLATLDPAQQQTYRDRLATFTEKWQGNIKRWQQQATPLAALPIVAHHSGWPYLNRWLNLNQVALLEPRPGIPPTSGHLSQLLSGLEQTPVRVIIHASYQNPRAAQWLAEKTGVPVVALDASPATGETLSQWYNRLITQLANAAS